MIARALLANGAKAFRAPIRQFHRGPSAAPPMRWMGVPVGFVKKAMTSLVFQEKIGIYLIIAFTFLSYPTYVLLNLDNIRPRPDNSLSEEAQAAMVEHKKARLAGFQPK
jgi:hypothetical protein